MRLAVTAVVVCISAMTAGLERHAPGEHHSPGYIIGKVVDAAAKVWLSALSVGYCNLAPPCFVYPSSAQFFSNVLQKTSLRLFKCHVTMQHHELTLYSKQGPKMFKDIKTCATTTKIEGFISLSWLNKAKSDDKRYVKI